MSGKSSGRAAPWFSRPTKTCASTSSELLPTKTCSGRRCRLRASASRSPRPVGSGYRRRSPSVAARIAASARGLGGYGFSLVLSLTSGPTVAGCSPGTYGVRRCTTSLQNTLLLLIVFPRASIDPDCRCTGMTPARRAKLRARVGSGPRGDREPGRQADEERGGETASTRAARKSPPCSTNQPPSARKASVLCGASAAMNCGSRARKKIATFGLSRLVSRPWRKIAPRVAARAAAGVGPATSGATPGDRHALRSMPAASHSR